MFGKCKSTIKIMNNNNLYITKKKTNSKNIDNRSNTNNYYYLLRLLNCVATSVYVFPEHSQHPDVVG
jgi:hypothetical protein